MRLCADHIYTASPQPTIEGYVRLPCPFTDTDYRYAEGKGRVGRGWRGTDKQRDKQTEGKLAEQTLSGCKWNNTTIC